MVQIISNKLTDYLEQQGIIKKEKEIYEIGLSITINYLLSCITILVITFFLHNTIETIVYLFAFSYLREYSGGYHADTHLNVIH